MSAVLITGFDDAEQALVVDAQQRGGERGEQRPCRQREQPGAQLPARQRQRAASPGRRPAIAPPAASRNGQMAPQPRPRPKAEAIVGWKEPLPSSRIQITVSVS